jgi:hypothetical protein
MARKEKQRKKVHKHSYSLFEIVYEGGGYSKPQRRSVVALDFQEVLHYFEDDLLRWCRYQLVSITKMEGTYYA